MDTTTFLAWAESLETMNYYEVLRVDQDAPLPVVQQAFHALALRCHPDRFVDEGPEVAAAAGAVFKRAAEAYNVLRKPRLRTRYDQELRKGGQGQKFDQHAMAEKPKFTQRTLEMIASTPRGKAFAAKADRFLSIGKLEEARIQLISAYQQEPSNDELKERLDILYEALALEPL